MSRDLKFVQDYQHPIERVWEALTDDKAIAAWLMPNDFKPVVGHRFQFKSKPQPGWNGIVDCEVLRVEAPRLLSYSWKGGPLDTVLTIELAAIDGGTRLSLEHTGFKGFKALLVAKLMGSGWKGIVSRGIPEVLEKLRLGQPLPANPYCH